MKQEFAVKCNSFILYKAFKEEIEEIGYKYNVAFFSFIETNMKTSNCFFFSDEFEHSDTPNMFSFSNTDGTEKAVFTLPEDWYEALNFAEDNYNEESEVIDKDIEVTFNQMFGILADHYKVDPLSIKLTL